MGFGRRSCVLFSAAFFYKNKHCLMVITLSIFLVLSGIEVYFGDKSEQAKAFAFLKVL